MVAEVIQAVKVVIRYATVMVIVPKMQLVQLLKIFLKLVIVCNKMVIAMLLQLIVPKEVLALTVAFVVSKDRCYIFIAYT